MDQTRSYWVGPEATHRRTMLKASGYGDKDIKRKPHIGVANSFMEGSPGSAHLRQIGEAVKQGIWAGGGIPFEFGVPATCGNVANGAEELKYELVGRDAVAMSIEFVTKVHNFDALVLIASCDNIIAGAYLAACRMNLPVIVVTGGSMLTGNYCGKKIVEAELDVATLKLQKDNIDKDSEEYKEEIKRLEELEEYVCPSFGACPSMGTANTMQMLGEVFNLVLPGTANIPAADNLKIRKSREAGEFIVDLCKRGVTPKELITKETLLNSIMVDMAIAGSTNAVLHILSMAKELDIDITLDDFSRLAAEIPCITGVIPSGPYSIEDFYHAGGMPVVMKMLESKLYTDVPTLYGNTWKDYLTYVRAQSTDVIRSLDQPLFNEPGLKVLYGNLSPNGAIIRPTGVPAEMKKFTGVAKCFDHEMDCFRAIQRDEVKPGDVLVIRYEGCKGAPGMKELMVTTDALVAHGLHKSVGLISDARFSGFNHGAIVGHVTPEAYDGGPIALVKDGDIITVDVMAGTIDVNVSDEEMKARRQTWVRPEPKVKKGILALYAALCKPADEGRRNAELVMRMKLNAKVDLDSFERQFTAVDSHTLGQFTRVVTSGFPHIEGNTMIEKKKFLEDHCQDLRTALMHEPRGHADMFGSVLMEPVHEEADLGVVYMDTGEYLNMCGHGTMGTATVCVEAGLVEMKEPYTDVVLDAPAGIIRTHVKVENKKATEVTITNVPSFVYKENLPLTIDGKEIVVDIVFAGNFFALVDASQFDFEIGAQNVSKFSKVGVKILDTIKETFPVKHPLLDITVVDHCEFYTKCPHEGADICNTVIFGAGQCDRSPCGTGTSSMLVKLHHMGKLKVGDSIVTESVIGSHFTGRIAQETTVGDFKAIVPQITGSAYITGVSTYLIDKDDPLKYGFQLG